MDLKVESQVLVLSLSMLDGSVMVDQPFGIVTLPEGAKVAIYSEDPATLEGIPTQGYHPAFKLL